ncbi:hypothetical protein OG272_20380 [Streptomyces sp. NBC_00104]|uniref:hypothetical protein n=1 Tax=Streptomyces sp. NBC_00104 TaxID=2903621 RepID=UPI0032456468
MRFLGKVFPVLGVVVFMSSTLSSCSDESSNRSNSPKGWSVCNELFGSSSVDALQGEMGSGVLRVENSLTPVDEIMLSLSGMARRWEPGSELHYAISEHPCDLGVEGRSDEFLSYVSWSAYSQQRIKAGEAGGGWQPVGKSIFVKREEGGLHLVAVISCKVEGTHEDQESQLPLEIETQVRNVPDFDVEVLRKMTAHFTRELVDGLKCKNSPEVPGAI